MTFITKRSREKNSDFEGMKSKTRLDSAVFQLTPTRTRCDLYIIANDSKEKIASGLLNPFIAHLKAAQDQIAQGGYSVLLTPPPPATNATWFTKSTLQSFVRFVSTPEILERVYTIESEILQIQEAISIQGNNDILVIEEDQHVNPVASSEGDRPAYDADEDKAIVLYKPGAQETTSSSAKEGNSKVQLLNVLETRKTVLKKEQGMAFARAVAAGFEIEHVANLLSFAECFGASRLMSGCLRFMDLWKQKHDSGQWVEVEAEAKDASGIVLSSMSNRHNETKETDPNPNAVAVGPHPGFPPSPSPSPWGMHSSPVPVPVYQAYPMPYYHQHYPGSAPFYPPPPPYPSSSMEMEMEIQKRRQSMDNNNEEEDSPQQHKNPGKKKSGRMVIRNINFINSKGQNSSQSDSDTDTENHTHKRSLKESESEALTLDGKETDSGHWDAFQNYLLKGNENMFAMEKDPKTKRRQKSMAEDPLANAERDGDGDGDGEGHRVDMQSYDYRNGRKIVYKSGSGDDFMIGTREEANVNVRGDNGFEGATVNFDRNGLYAATATDEAEAVMVSMLSTSGVNDDNRSSMNLESYDLPPSTSQNQESKSNRQVVKYEPDALSLMPERDLEKRPVGYDPALDYEMQSASAAASREKKSKTEVKKVSKSAEKHQQSKANQGVGRKGKPSSKVNNNNTLEDARARAEKLRSYKADLQKMKKEQQDAEVKRLEGLKMERQKRIAARANSSRQQQQLASKLPLRGSKFTDSEPGSSSPLQRSKIRPASIGSTNSKKPLTLTLTNSSSKLANGGNRLTRSLSSMSDTKSVTITPTPTPDSKTRIRRLSEPKKTNNNNITSTSTSTKTRSAEPPVSKSKKISCAIISLDQSKAASLAEIKIRTSKVSSNQSQRVKLKLKLKEDDKAVVAKMSLNDNPAVIDKSVVMLEHHGTGAKVPLSMEVVDKGTISVHPTCTSTCTEVRKTCVEEVELGENPEYKAPYARVSSFEDPSTRNSEYAKAPQSQSTFGMSAGTEKAYVSDFNKLEKIPEVLEKPRGFRRLLKLGKKNHTPSDTDTQNAPQADTLKTLISSEDQTPTTHGHGQTCQKSSRHFSLLSSFRGKTTEKKPTA